MLIYPVGTSGQQVLLADNVIQYLLGHRQRRFWQKEAGGQLFARLEGPRLVIVEATGPRSTDRRTRTTYFPDRGAEILEIRERHKRNLHFVGDWHTHPDSIPQPSRRDVESMADCFAKSSHQLNGFLLLIVGKTDPPSGFNLTVHTGRESFILDGQHADAVMR